MFTLLKLPSDDKRSVRSPQGCVQSIVQTFAEVKHSAGTVHHHFIISYILILQKQIMISNKMMGFTVAKLTLSGQQLFIAMLVIRYDHSLCSCLPCIAHVHKQLC